MQLFIIRHCESENNALWKRTGSDNGRFSDPALTTVGQQQAQVLADFLSRASAQKAENSSAGMEFDNFNFTHLYCSLMRRSVQTGTPIAKALNLPLVAHYDIHERGGIYLKDPQTEVNEGLPGPNRAHFEQHHPELILPESLGEKGWWNRSYEDTDQALERARVFLRWLENEHGGGEDRVAIITHGGFIQSLIAVLLGADLLYVEVKPEREIWIKSNNGSISRVDFWSDFIRVSYVNRVEFYPPYLIT
ncbi:MAG: histidine phosphatase family protein [Candidatus Promineifilaceae bacterium]|nr:histidine phosphatase family protein [Candidatus Promineifilaceae bacterium]